MDFAIMLRCTQCLLYRSESLFIYMWRRWTCAICGLEQPLGSVHYRGSSADCSLLVSRFNEIARFHGRLYQNGSE
uniref:MRN complex-interacting protein N-terminal domain-containing protein n=1 Tax=Tetranychus urticae TaxID=32264 RepID=T1K665_TETUR